MENKRPLLTTDPCILCSKPIYLGQRARRVHVNFGLYELGIPIAHDVCTPIIEGRYEPCQLSRFLNFIQQEWNLPLEPLQKHWQQGFEIPYLPHILVGTEVLLVRMLVRLTVNSLL